MIAFLRRLNVQMLLLLSITLFVSGILSGWATAKKQSGILIESMKKNSSVLVRHIAESSAYYLVLNDYAGLESFLLKSAELPDIKGFHLCEPNGTVIVNIERKPGLNPEARIERSVIIPPASQSAVIDAGKGDLIVWQPIEAGKMLGWIRASYSMSGIRKVQSETLRSSVTLAIIWIAVSSLTLFVLLRPTVRTFGRLADFAAQLDERKGEQIAMGHMTKEIDDLASSLNHASKQLFLTEQQMTKDKEELRESEERLQRIIETEPECIKILDRQGCLLHMNPAGLGMIEAEYLEQVIGKPVIDLISPEYREAYLRLHERVISGEAMQMEYEIIGLKGGRRWMQTHAVPMKHAAEIVHLAVTRDITERRKAEQELKELNAALEQRIAEEVDKNRDKDQILAHQARLAAMGEMIGAIAHQWRQPLNALGLILQDIPDAKNFGQLTDEYLAKSVEKGMKQLQFMSKTIDDFRNFFRPDKEKTLFDVKMAIADVLSMISAQLKSNDISYRLTCHEHNKTYEDFTEVQMCGEFTIQGYENEFRQVFLNLISNAKDAIIEKRAKGLMGKNEKGQIYFDFDRDGDKVIMRITDNGGGIPESVIDKIFDPYFTTKEQGKGTGIGLYMSKMIIEQNMGGKLSVRNVEGGVEFRIEFSA